jgi:SAM-dependent methyltransferase
MENNENATVTPDGEHTTAHRFWDTQWANGDTRKKWETPDGRILNSIRNTQGKPRVLDLGCGAGRHALAVAEAGFDAYACDASATSVSLVGAALAERNLPNRATQAHMTALPYPDGTFDWVIAWNVLYHGSRSDLVSAVREAARVLKKGGCLEGTFISKRNVHFGKGVSIDEHTWIDDSVSDKAHPHSYASREELLELLSDFTILELEEYGQDNYENAWHWYVRATRNNA